MSTFGRLYKVTTFGESHGKGVGCVVDGFPPSIKIDLAFIQNQLNRRKPNQNSLLTARNEPDLVEIYSGVENGVSLGTPLSMIVLNQDYKPDDYKSFSNVPRPGHADYSYLAKYGVKSQSGGGRASARETISRVAAGALADLYLNEKFNIEIVAWVSSIGHIELPCEIKEDFIHNPPSRSLIDTLGKFDVFQCDTKEYLYFNDFMNKLYVINSENKEISNIEDFSIDVIDKFIFLNEKYYKYIETISIRCPDNITALKMIDLIRTVKDNQDSIGGCISCIISNVPIGLGEPCFDKFEAELAKAMLSIPATKGFEIGSGFEGTKLKLEFLI